MIDLNLLRTQRFLGLGCSTFGGSAATGVAKISLAKAFDQGIVYFDVARSYGYGQAEGIVGQFAQGKRDKMIIASKFGISPPPIPFKSLVLWGMRNIRKALPASRQTLAKAGVNALTKTQFTPQAAQSSLQTSLRELKTDYIDLFLLHESYYADCLRDDIREVLERAKEKGQIRAWGATLGERGCLQRQLSSSPLLEAVQFPFGQDTTYAQALGSATAIPIVYSVLNYYKSSGLLGRGDVLAEIKADFPGLHFINTLPELLLYLAFHQLQAGVMLSSMTTANNIDRNIFLFTECTRASPAEMQAVQTRLKSAMHLAPEMV
ncbi:aldo/keto reductase [Hymenobacter nivis]|uniref:Aldo/keto reductase n=1 Tax=Hymenobacter nivis TaxID=1850093 RepID=A0A502GBS2_9BACT|nr:aldo/keto reductase [Hymenobacter nivis]TPG58938.1 aldo/keto reductase [Hymenobacter nivis]